MFCKSLCAIWILPGACAQQSLVSASIYRCKQWHLPVCCIPKSIYFLLAYLELHVIIIILHITFICLSQLIITSYWTQSLFTLGQRHYLLFYKQFNIARHDWPTHGLLHCSLDIWCMKALHHNIYWFQVLFIRLVTLLRWLICPSAPPSHFKFSHAVQSWSAT